MVERGKGQGEDIAAEHRGVEMAYDPVAVVRDAGRWEWYPVSARSRQNENTEMAPRDEQRIGGFLGIAPNRRRN